MSVSIKSNFLTNARGLTFEDGGGITWSINANTNQITATAGSAGTATTATNLAAGADGSIPYQTAAGITAFLGVGSTGQLLTVSGGVPAWEAVPTWNQNTTGSAATATTAGNVTGVVAVGNGGTGQTTAITGFEALSPMTTTGDMIYAPGAGTAARLAIGSSGQFLKTAGGIPSWTSFTVANPSASIGLSAVNGSTGNWMDAGSAPALSVTISPTWTGNHVFAPSSGNTVVSAGNFYVGASTAFGKLAVESSAASLSGFTAWTSEWSTFGPNIGSSTGAALGLGYGSGGGYIVSVAPNTAWETLTIGASSLVLNTNGGTLGATFGSTAVISTALGVNGNAAPAQSTGWGAPTGASVENNFAGASASLTTCSAAIAELITVLKAVGFLGA
jgi:hypothetical protein